MTDTTDQVCQWAEADPDYGQWVSECGESFDFANGTPTENGFQYCPYCGKPISEVEGGGDE